MTGTGNDPAVRRFYIEPDQLCKPEPRITGKDVRHIRSVLRMSPGDGIRVVDGTGGIYAAQIAAFEEDAVRVTNLRPAGSGNESPLELIVAQGILKDRKTDDLVRRLTELGITRYIPVITQRTIARPDERRMEKRLARWRAIAVEALKQCGRSMVPRIDPVMDFPEVLDLAKNADLGIFFWERAQKPLLKDLGERPGSVMLVLGPEGGFTEEEARWAEECGLRAISLGSRILRAETAAVAACTLAQYLFGDLQKSP